MCWSQRLFRDGKAAISAEVTGILDRLQSSAESWRARLEKVRGGRLLGRFFAASRERLSPGRRTLGGTSPGKPRRMPGAIARWQSATRSQVSPCRSAPVVRSPRAPIGQSSFRNPDALGVASGRLSRSTTSRRRRAMHVLVLCPPQ